MNRIARAVFCLLVILMVAIGSFAQIAPSTITQGSNATTGYGPWPYKDLGNSIVLYKMLGFENGAGNGGDGCLFRSSAGYLSWWNCAGTTQQGSLVNAEGAYQGTTAVPITTTSFTALVAAASDIQIPGGATGGTAGTISKINKRVRIHGDGVYTTGAASLLNAEVMLCTVSGCGSGTVVAPAGCAITTTNQANVLANGQFTLDCTLTTTTAGATGTLMAKGVVCATLGSATTAALSCFADTAVAASAAVDLTVPEFVNVAFKFSTSNAANTATLDSYSVEVLN